MMKLFPLFALSFIIGLSTACSKQKVSTLTNPNCTDSVYYSTQIKPMMDTYCLSCHGVGNSTAYTITNHSNTSSNATNILKAMRGELQLMPQNGPALNDSLIQQFNCWINQGKLNN